LTICFYQENWNRIALTHSAVQNHADYFEVIVDRETELIFQAHQTSIAILSNEALEYAPIELRLAKSSDRNISFIGISEDSLEGRRTSSIIKNYNPIIKLIEGAYILRVKKAIVDANRFPDYTISTSSTYPIQIKPIDDQSLWKHFIQMCYIDIGSKYPVKYHMGKKRDFLSGWCGNHLWIYCSNGSKHHWNLEIKFDQLENLKLSKFYKVDDRTFHLMIPPKSKTSTYLKRVRLGAAKMKWSFKQKELEELTYSQ